MSEISENNYYPTDAASEELSYIGSLEGLALDIGDARDATTVAGFMHSTSFLSLHFDEAVERLQRMNLIRDRDKISQTLPLESIKALSEYNAREHLALQLEFAKISLLAFRSDLEEEGRVENFDSLLNIFGIDIDQDNVFHVSESSEEVARTAVRHAVQMSPESWHRIEADVWQKNGSGLYA